MPSTLLEKTRRLNRFLQSSGSDFVLFSDLCKMLEEILECNVFVLSRSGKILGYGLRDEIEESYIHYFFTPDLRLNEVYNDKLLKLDEPLYNTKGFLQDIDVYEQLRERLLTVVPVFCGGKRLGTILFDRIDKTFTEDDIILAEYGATIVGMEIMRAHSEAMEEEARQISNVQMAISSLSYSELEAVIYILDELGGMEGLLVASKIADRIGITRSVIVNALRKLESAGIIESRSLGMKGTYIKILNEKIFKEIKK